MRSVQDVETLRAALGQRLDVLDRKAPALVDYDNFLVLLDALDAYMDMVRDGAAKHYSRITRYTTSAFPRAKLRGALLQLGEAPHIFESFTDARKQLQSLGTSGTARMLASP